MHMPCTALELLFWKLFIDARLENGSPSTLLAGLLLVPHVKDENKIILYNCEAFNAGEQLVTFYDSFCSPSFSPKDS